jgi:tRNA isopentenyl-2-thiomethyl-A-37 hydroxylase MiaE
MSLLEAVENVVEIPATRFAESLIRFVKSRSPSRMTVDKLLIINRLVEVTGV